MKLLALFKSKTDAPATPPAAPSEPSAVDRLYKQLARIEVLHKRAHIAAHSIHDASHNMESEIRRALAHDDLEPDERRALMGELTTLHRVQGYHRHVYEGR